MTSICLLKLCVCILAACVVRAAPSDGDSYMNVTTSYGTVRGRVVDNGGSQVAKFFGIPYAQPPIGSLRFKAPAKPMKWDGVKDSLHFGNQCLQLIDTPWKFKVGNDTTTYGEDCLYLNVFLPKDNQSINGLPVMVRIHGGAYTTGAGSQFDGTTLATKGVIVVTINYRLDVFGFLSTEDDVMPGNYGMLDQIAALQWVKENIAAFGGDPNQVTIFGESAGASSVSLLTLSPLAKGLFQRAIMESGTSLCPWAVQNPVNRVSLSMMSRLIGSEFNCTDLQNTATLYECLQKVDAERLINASIRLYNVLNAGLIYSPRIETDFGFLPDLPINLLSRGEFNHVDTIYGFNGDETGVLILNLLLNKTITADVIRSAVKVLTPNLPYLQENQVITLLKKTYMTNTANDTTKRQQTVDSLDDYFYAGAVELELRKVVQSAAEKSHFMYRFSHRPSWHKQPHWTSAFHGDEIGYVFGIQQPEFTQAGFGPPDNGDIAVSAQVMEMWTNFAKTGSPTSTVPTGGCEWKQFSLSSPYYIDIDTNSVLKIYQRKTGFYEQIIDILDFGSGSTVPDQVVG